MKSSPVLRIAIPSIISNITVPLLGLADTAIAGHLGSAAYLGAIAVGTTLFATTYWLFAFLRMGTGGLTAQAFGAGRKAEVALLLARSLLLALAIAGLLLMFQRPILHWGLTLIAPTAAVGQWAEVYFRLLIWGAPATLSLFALNGWLLGMQDARSPMWVAVVQNVVNVLLSLALVVGLDWKMEGVALGTLVAQWTGALLALAFALRRLHRGGYAVRWSAVWRDGVAWRQLFAVNSDIFLRTLCLVAVMFTFTAIGARQGETLLSVNALLMQFYLLVSYVMDGFAYAGEALGGRFLGEGRVEAFRALVRQLFAWGLGLSGVFSLGFLLGGEGLVALLTDSEAVRDAAPAFLPYAVAMPLIGFSAFLLDGLCIGTTATRAMLLGVATASAAFFLIHCLLSPLLGNHALWIAFLLYLALRAAVQGALLPRIVRTKFLGK